MFPYKQNIIPRLSAHKSQESLTIAILALLPTTTRFFYHKLSFMLLTQMELKKSRERFLQKVKPLPQIIKMKRHIKDILQKINSNKKGRIELSA